MTLPGGFSPKQALKQAGDNINPFNGTTDYDVFSQYQFGGGDRQATGGWVSPQWSSSEVAGAPAPSSAPAPTSSTAGGGGYVAPDPYARWGGEAQYNAQRDNYSTSARNQRSGAQTQLRDVGNTYDDRTNSYVDDITGGQGDLNRGFSGNELNLRRSMQNIVRSIQSGVRSGGVALAGVNASDSGASDAMARAYAKSGNQQSGEARGQAGEKFEDLQRQQGSLEQKRRRGAESLDRWGDTETGRVRSDFGGKIDALSADAEANGFGGVVDKSVVDQVLGEALARLSGIDQSRNSRLAGVKQWTPDQIMKEAIRLDELGVAGNTFNTTGPEVSYGGNGVPINGAVMGEMPIYVRGKDEGIANIPLTRTKVEQATV